MKCRLIRDDMEVSPGVKLDAEHEAQTTMRLVRRNGKDKVPVKFFKLGAVLSSPDAFRLVNQGCAEPADEECAAKCDVRPEVMETRKAAYQRLAAGIDPVDYSAYDAGYMTGYDGEGNWIPGPNYAEYLALVADAEDEEADDTADDEEAA